MEDIPPDQAFKIIQLDLIIAQMHVLAQQKTDLLSIAGDFDKPGKPGRDARLTAIMNTAGNKETNNLFVQYSGLLRDELESDYPNEKMLKMRKIQIDKAFEHAVAGHFQTYENIIKDKLTATFGGDFVEGEQVLSKKMLRKLKKKRDELVYET